MRLARLAAATFAVVALANAPEVSASAASAATVRVARNIQYGVADGAPLLLDAYLPPAGGLYPGVVAIHGGAWWSGDKSEWAASCRQLAAVGFACFSVNYRLAPRYPYPAAVDDVTAATRWVRENAGRYGVDPTRLGAIGSSAGGHLAAMIGVVGDGPTDAGARVNVVVSWSGVFDFATFDHDRPATDSLQHVNDFVGCDVTLPSCAPKAREASHVTSLDPSDPPMFMANSDAELVPVSQPTEMAGDLEAKGVPYEFIVIPGNHHGAELKNQVIASSGQTVFAQSVAFLKRWIGVVSGGPVSSTREANRLPETPANGGSDRGGLLVAAGVVAALTAIAGGLALARRRLP
jgi:acetyl esterase